jgi:DNA gyrase subunit B
VPPLYHVKVGNQEFYFEKDAQLPVSFTETRYDKFVQSLNRYEGFRAKLGSEFGEAVQFVIAQRLVEHDAATLADLEQVIAALPANGFELSILERDGDQLKVRAVESETSAASHVSLPVELVGSEVYAGLRRAYEKVTSLSGLPPFTVRYGKKTAEAATFAELREAVLDLAKEGLQLSRFKGLGEMNPEQLWETTMDPARRLLIRVDVEDASAADQMFSVLMGDQVEPRRAFIEQNARDVRFLDV